MATKKNFKSILLQLCIGVGSYFLFVKGMQQSTKPKGVLIVGDLLDDGLDYQPIYFKDSEYFGKNDFPDDFRKNYTNLVRVLDKIRVRFGSAILIIKGFERSENGVISNGFQNCTSVEIYPQNKDVKHLDLVLKDMMQKKEINLSECINVGGSKIKLTIL